MKELVHFQPQAFRRRAVGQIAGDLDVPQRGEEVRRDFGDQLGRGAPEAAVGQAQQQVFVGDAAFDQQFAQQHAGLPLLRVRRHPGFGEQRFEAGGCAR